MLDRLSGGRALRVRDDTGSLPLFLGHLRRAHDQGQAGDSLREALSAAKHEAKSNLRDACCRRAPLLTWIAGVSLAWSDVKTAVWHDGEWRGNPRFLGMYGVLFETFDRADYWFQPSI